jgi:two-component system, LuxR family, sensor kinase FixL
MDSNELVNKKRNEMSKLQSNAAADFETKKLALFMIITAVVLLAVCWFISDLWFFCISLLFFCIAYVLYRNSLNKQKQMSAKTEEQKEFLDNILQSLQHPLLVFDANDYTILLANSAAYRGVMPSGLKCYEFFHKRTSPCEENEYTCVINEVKRTGKSTILEYTNYDEKGRPYDVEVHGYPVYDENGQLKQVIEYALNIEDRKKTENALKDAKEQAERLLKLVPSGICTVDTNRIVTSVNDRWCEMTGFSHEEIIGKPCTDFAIEPCRVKCGLYANDVKKPVIGRECKIRTKDGRVLIISKNADFLRDADGNIIGGIESFEDMTIAKQNEETQKQLVEELQAVNMELSDFAYIISHDLKAPLRGITTLAEWLVTDYSEKFDDDGKEQMKLLAERVNRMQKMIDGVLQYSRVGRVREEKSSINLNEILPQIIDSIDPPSHIKITIENELPTILFEPTRITQVFQNLLSNAVKYLNKPEGLVRIGSGDEGDYLKFYVADNGQGIEEKYFEKIFQLFQTLSTNKSSESTGVGLTVVKKIVELYGGKIWVESRVGQGSTFYFTVLKNNVGVEKDEKLEADLVGGR